MRTRCDHFGRLLAAGIIIISHVAAAQSMRFPYAATPAWWDSIALKTPPADQATSATQLWNWLTASYPLNGSSVTNWYLIGPFAGADGAGFDAVYPPEQKLERKPMPGKDGAQVNWEEWKPGAPCPVPANLTNSVIYACKSIPFAMPANGFLFASGDDRIRVWFDDRVILPQSGPLNTSTNFPLQITTGTHVVLVKIYQEKGAWGFRIGWSDYDPRLLEIKLRSMVVWNFQTNVAAVTGHAERLVDLYQELSDATNFGFWASYVLQATADPARQKALCAGWVKNCGDSQPLLTELFDELECYIGNNRTAATNLMPSLFSLGVSLQIPDLISQCLRVAGLAPTFNQFKTVLPIYAQSEAPNGLAYWINGILDRTTNLNTVASVLDTAQRGATTLVRPIIHEITEKRFETASADDARRFYADHYISMAITNLDTEGAKYFLAKHESDLGRLMGWEAIMWRLRIANLEQDPDAANEALESAVKLKPEYAKSREYIAFKYRIIRFGNTRPIIDIAFETMPNTLPQLFRSSGAEAFNQLILNSLLDKGGACVADDADNALFIGAKSRYRALFREYASGYASFFSNRIAFLNTESSGAGKAFERIGALEAPAQDTSLPPLSPGPGAGGAPKRFHPKVELIAGVAEIVARYNRARFGADADWLWGDVVDAGDSVVIQNSRTIAAVASQGTRWAHALPLCTLWPEGKDAPIDDCRGETIFLGAPFTPAINGGIVGARLVVPGMGVTMAGINLANGVPLWHLNEAGLWFASSPATWNEYFLVLGVTIRDPSRIELVALDAQTGQIAFRIPLGNGSRHLQYIRENKVIRHEGFWSIPAPIVIDDAAYIDTCLGLFGAVDLADRSIRWLRSYPRRLDLAVLAQRRPAPPIVGQATIAFLPNDATAVFLVDRRNGKLIKKRSDLVWTTGGAAGPDHVALTTRDAVFVLDMAGLEEKAVAKIANALWFDATSDGCLLTSSNRLMALDRSGAIGSTVDFPAAMVPARYSAKNLFAFDWESMTFGTLDSIAQQDPPPLRPTLAMPAPEFGVPAASILAMTNGAVLAREDFLRKLDAAGRCTWESPHVALSPNSIGICGDNILLAENGRGLIIDADTGERRKTWPAQWGATVIVEKVFATGNSGFALARSGGATLLVDLNTRSVAAPEIVGTLPNYVLKDTSFFAFPTDTGLYFAAWVWNSQGGLFVLPPAPSNAAPALRNFKLVQDMSGNDVMFQLAPDNSRLTAYFYRNRKKLTLTPAGAEMETIPGSGLLWSNGVSFVGNLLKTDFIHKSVFYDIDSTNTFEFAYSPQPYLFPSHSWRSGTFATSERRANPGAVFYLQTGNMIRGLMLPIRYLCQTVPSPCTPFRVSLERDAKPIVGSVTTNMIFSWSEVRGMLIFPDANVFTLCNLPHWDDQYGFMWTGTNIEPRAFLFPSISIAAPTGPISTGACLYAESIVTRDDLQRLLGPLAAPLATNHIERGPVLVDGFLDEWRDDEFISAARGRFAIRRAKSTNDMWIAVEIADPQLATAMAAAGVDGKIEFLNMPGRFADFRWDSSQQSGRAQALRTMDDKLRNPFFACTFEPDGRRCRLELQTKYFPDNRRHTSGNPKSNDDDLRQFGHLAFRLTWRKDVLSPRENLLADHQTGPLSFTRLALPR